MGRVTARRRARHLGGNDTVTRPETLAVEEPLEIRVNGTPRPFEAEYRLLAELGLRRN